MRDKVHRIQVAILGQLLTQGRDPVRARRDDERFQPPGSIGMVQHVRDQLAVVRHRRVHNHQLAARRPAVIGRHPGGCVPESARGEQRRLPHVRDTQRCNRLVDSRQQPTIFELFEAHAVAKCRPRCLSRHSKSMHVPLRRFRLDHDCLSSFSSARSAGPERRPRCFRHSGRRVSQRTMGRPARSAMGRLAYGWQGTRGVLAGGSGLNTPGLQPVGSINPIWTA